MLMFAATALAGCSSEPAPSVDREVEIPTPPGTARLLSLGSHLVDGDESSAELALNCAIALRVTEIAVAPLATSANAEEMELIGRAAKVYTDRAVAAGEGSTGQAIRNDIVRQAKEKTEDKSEQAQLAIVCLRALEQR